MDIDMLMALVATVVIEWGVLRLMGENRWRVLLSSVVVNVLTNVSLNLWLQNVDFGWPLLFAAEVVIIVVEALWYWLFVRELQRAVAYSVLCNVISLCVGLLFFFLVDYMFIINENQ